MADTIESFVAKLQSEGVDAGNQEAEKIRAEADRHGRQTLDQAREEAARIVEEAQAQAQALLERAETELSLAARDAATKLRDALNKALQAVIRHGAQGVLEDADFLSKLLHDLVVVYARAEHDSTATATINVQAETREKLTQWALHELKTRAEDANLAIDLKGSLDQAGFEYRIEGATVEVTLDSVVEVLSEMVGAQLREILDEAMTGWQRPQETVADV